MPQINEFRLQGLVESFAHRIVFGSPRTIVVLLNLQSLISLFRVFGKLRSVAMTHSGNFSFQEVM